MATYEIIKLDLKKEYQPEIKGLGEIYEKMSVSYLQKKMKKKYQKGVLFLSSNIEHQGRGVSRKELESYLKNQGYQILESGFVDSPPWKSRPETISREKSYLKLPWFIALVKIFFWFLVKLEFIWQKKNNSHMVFCLSKNEV